MRIMLFITNVIAILLPQDNIDQLIQHVLHGAKDSAAISFPTIELDYPNNPSVMYLKGLLETDGEQAMVIFAKLYNTHPSSDYSDDTVMKVAEYYYAEGLYIQASKWLKKMPVYYSRSEHIERAVKLFLNSLIVSGNKDTAIFYSRVFERQFPHLNVDGKIKGLIREFEESDLKEKKENSEFTTKYTLDNLTKDSQLESKLNDNNRNNSDALYSVQTGAFSIRENAESQRIDLTIAGFDARVIELYRNMA